MTAHGISLCYASHSHHHHHHHHTHARVPREEKKPAVLIPCSNNAAQVSSSPCAREGARIPETAKHNVTASTHEVGSTRHKLSNGAELILTSTSGAFTHTALSSRGRQKQASTVIPISLHHDTPSLPLTAATRRVSQKQQNLYTKPSVFSKRGRERDVHNHHQLSSAQLPLHE